MTKHERVMRTVRFEETDRIPVYDLLQNDAIVEYYAGRKLTIENGLESVGLAVGNMLDMTRMVGGPQEPRTVEWWAGLVIRVERWTSWIVERPFKEVPELIDWVKDRIREANDTRYDQAYVANVHKAVEARWADFVKGDTLGENDPTVFVMESGAGLTEIYWAVGMDLFTVLVFEYPDLVQELLDARNRAEVRRIAAIANPHYIPIALTYDDIAHKNGTLFSPDWLRQYWLPCLKRIVDAWHERDTYCLFHSDGNLWSVLDDLTSVGIDGLNPLEVLASMDVKSAREKYPKLFLAGGIDVSQLLTYGTPEEVRETCRQAIADTNGRGYFMGSTTELHWDVNLENAIAMVETARANGKI
jgi:hypothetical protein